MDAQMLRMFLLALTYAYPAALGYLNFKKFRDWPSLAMVPSLSWMALYFCISAYIPRELATFWGSLGFLVLSLSILITVVWRYSMLRGYKWIR